MHKPELTASGSTFIRICIACLSSFSVEFLKGSSEESSQPLTAVAAVTARGREAASRGLADASSVLAMLLEVGSDDRAARCFPSSPVSITAEKQVGIIQVLPGCACGDQTKSG